MLIITNFKTYETALGEQALQLAKIHEEVALAFEASLAVAPSIIDIEKISSLCPRLPIFSQHVDAAGYGSFTGKVPPLYLKNIGVSGTLLNHSECRLDRTYLKDCCDAAKAAGLKVVICAENVDEGVELLELCHPHFIAIEPPELIGGDISVSTANPEIISDAAERIGSEHLIVGAGVKNANDVRIAKELGASGVLLASGVTKSEDPKAVLQDLISGTK